MKAKKGIDLQTLYKCGWDEESECVLLKNKWPQISFYMAQHGS